MGGCSAPSAGLPLVSMMLASLAGCLLVTQNGINTTLRYTAFPNPFMTTALSFSVGVASVLSAAAVHKPNCFSDGTSLRQAPWYSFLGGPLGTCYVVAAVLLSLPLGFATFQLAATLGQLTSSLVCDTIGFLILPKRKPTAWRLFALAIMCCATIISIEGLSVEGEWWAVVLYLILSFGAGSIFPMQACVNGVMTQHVKTPLRASCVSFIGGASVMWIATAITSATPLADWPDEESAGPGPAGSEFWMYLGGTCGAFVVSAHVFGVPAIGAARFTVLFISSQLCTSLIFDGVGAFGYKAMPPSPRRLVGVILAICASAAYQLGPPPMRTWTSTLLRSGWPTRSTLDEIKDARMSRGTRKFQGGDEDADRNCKVDLAATAA